MHRCAKITASLQSKHLASFWVAKDRSFAAQWFVLGDAQVCDANNVARKHRFEHRSHERCCERNAKKMDLVSNRQHCCCGVFFDDAFFFKKKQKQKQKCTD